MEKNDTDRFVRESLNALGLIYDEQCSKIINVHNSLKTASKTGKGGAGHPEFVIQYKEDPRYLVIIEDKEKNDRLIKLLDDGNLDMGLGSDGAVNKYAVNGAVHYAQCIFDYTNEYETIISIGVTGNERMHNISSYAITNKGYKPLGEWENFELLKYDNLKELIDTKIYNKKSRAELEEKEIIEIANELNEDMRKYGNVQEHWKPLIVSGIVLALKETDFRETYKVTLKHDDDVNDGTKIYSAISRTLNNVSAGKNYKIDILLNEFSFLKTDINLNEYNAELNASALKYLVDKIDNKVYVNLAKGKFDILGKFYSRFLKYSSGQDSSALGIVLTPNHITGLFCELAELKSTDIVLDICTGSGGFLVSAMNYIEHLIENDNLLSLDEKKQKIKNMKSTQLHGIENKSNLFTIATTNMILRGDGKSNLIYANCFSVDEKYKNEIKATVGMINPPYALAKKYKDAKLSEWSFILKMLGTLQTGGTGLAIVPISTAVGVAEYDRMYKKELLGKHSLKAVITMPGELFYPVGTSPCIMIFKAHTPHDINSRVKFINFTDDGCIKHKKLGRITTKNTEERIKYLLDVYFDKQDAPESIMIKAQLGKQGIEPYEEEWIHSYYYFDDSLPQDEWFNNKISEYLKFKTNQIIDGKEYLFDALNHDEEG